MKNIHLQIIPLQSTKTKTQHVAGYKHKTKTIRLFDSTKREFTLAPAITHLIWSLRKSFRSCKVYSSFGMQYCSSIMFS